MTNSLANCSKEEIDPGWRPKNQILVDFLRMMGKVIQSRASDTPCSLIMALKSSKWSKRSMEPSNDSTVGILNRIGTSSFKICWEKGDYRLKSLPSCELSIWISISFFLRSWIFCPRPSTPIFLLGADDSTLQDWSVRSKTWLRERF